jgi:hypothetical protein
VSEGGRWVGAASRGGTASAPLALDGVWRCVVEREAGRRRCAATASASPPPPPPQTSMLSARSARALLDWSAACLLVQGLGTHAASRNKPACARGREKGRKRKGRRCEPTLSSSAPPLICPAALTSRAPARADMSKGFGAAIGAGGRREEKRGDDGGAWGALRLSCCGFASSHAIDGWRDSKRWCVVCVGLRRMGARTRA